MSYRLVLALAPLLAASLCEAQTDLTNCVNVDKVMTFLALYKKTKNSYPQSQLIAKIKEFGFCARPTEAELARIRAAEGSSDLLVAIDEATRGPGDLHLGEHKNVPPPPPPKTGTLRVVCEP